MSAAGGLFARFKGQLRLLIGFAISGFCIWSLLRLVSPEQMLAQIAKANVPILLVCVVTVLISMVLKVVRWRLLFPRREGLAVRPLLAALYVGYMANTVLPGRVGELIRGFLVGQRTPVNASTALATIVIEKLLDIGTLALILVALLLLDRREWPDWTVTMAQAAGAALVVGAAGLVVMLLARRWVEALVDTVERRLPLAAKMDLGGLARSFLDGLAAISRPSVVPPLVFWSALLWATATLTLYTAIIGSGVEISMSAALLVLVVTNLGMAVPSAPGYVGVYQWLVILALAPYGIGADEAAGAGLLTNVLIFGLFVVGGSWFLWRDGLSLRQLERASHAQAHEEQPPSERPDDRSLAVGARAGSRTVDDLGPPVSLGGNVTER